VPADIQAAMWRKFLFIAAISGVGGVTRTPIGVTRSRPETRRLLEAAMSEVDALARARGIRLPEEIVAQTLAFIDGMGPGVMASMQRDIMDGKPSELEAQNGAVVRMGREMGIPTPVHEFLYASLLPQELKARGEI
jgi:2-dehydropantoate 2-reductase